MRQAHVCGKIAAPSLLRGDHGNHEWPHLNLRFGFPGLCSDRLHVPGRPRQAPVNVNARGWETW
jgi:hypothetical protein